ncbi:hypothetical protein WJR50_12595 [Catalinimonas sp. 4WD22]|uniref:hypothetical protein n=1 Tax=Catalinimonas locisalis TaxID=3133978 RepID=UPI0031019893
MIRTMLILIVFANVALGQGMIQQYDRENFAMQVKQIDEFIERFNNTDSTLVKKYLKEQYDLEVSRKDLVLSLFDLQSKNWDQQQIKQFLEDVVYSSKPPYLSFYDRNWYANVECSADYQGQAISFELVMSTVTNPKKGTVNWVIRSLNASDIDFCGSFDFNTLLPPNGHGTNFLELRRMFTNPKNYYDHTQPEENLMNQMLQMAAQGDLEFLGVKNIAYHFLQLDRWIIRVEEIEQSNTDTISGWLIRALIQANEEEKEKYLYNHLYIK